MVSEFEEWIGFRKTKVRRQVIRAYRMILFSDGQERLREVERTQTVEVARRGVSVQEAEKVLKAGGKMSLGELLRHKVRFFVDGGVIGGREFVEEVWQEKRDRFGPRRQSGARPIGESEAPLFSLRALRVRAIECGEALGLLS